MEVIINPLKFILLQSRASVARLAHNQEVGGSIPLSASNFMASTKKGTLAKPLQWWKHLKEYKKIFWKTERRLTKKDIRKRLED